MTHAYLNFQAERERQLDYHYMEDQRREWELKVSSIFMIIDKLSMIMKLFFPGREAATGK